MRLLSASIAAEFGARSEKKNEIPYCRCLTFLGVTLVRTFKISNHADSDAFVVVASRVSAGFGPASALVDVSVLAH